MASPHPTRAQEPTASPSPPPRAVESKIAQAFSFEALKKRSPWFAVPWDVRVKELKRHATIGTVASFALHYAGSNPKTILRGVLTRETPRLAIRGAAIGTLFQLSLWSVEAVCGREDMCRYWFIAMPIAAALYAAPKGLKAALTAAKGFIGMAVFTGVGANAPVLYFRVMHPEMFAEDQPPCGRHVNEDTRDTK